MKGKGSFAAARDRERWRRRPGKHAELEGVERPCLLRAFCVPGTKPAASTVTYS